jgi:hypothetical protein
MKLIEIPMVQVLALLRTKDASTIWISSNQSFAIDWGPHG